MLIYYILLAVLIFLSAFFSGIETAFFSLSDIKINTMIDRKKKNAQLVADLKSDPQKLLITILIGNNLVNIAAASLATVIVGDIFGSAVVGITTGIMTLIILIFGEITPKSLSIRYNEFITRLTSRPLFLIEKFLSPITWVFKKVYPKGSLRTPAITEEELRIMASVGVQEGTVQKGEAEIIKKVFQLNDITAKNIMVPRSELYAFSGDKKLKQVKEKIINSPFSRIPVYEKSIDHIIGILYKNDALIYLSREENKSNIKLKKIAREAIFVPESKFIDDLMRQFQSQRIHMGIVVNEYGEVTGIVTLEDILEELVGEITDETDLSKESIKRINKRKILVYGKTEIKHINRFFNSKLDQEYNTISGLIEDKLNNIPKPGQQLKINNLLLEVKEADKKTIKKVIITKK